MKSISINNLEKVNGGKLSVEGMPTPMMRDPEEVYEKDLPHVEDSPLIPPMGTAFILAFKYFFGIK